MRIADNFEEMAALGHIYMLEHSTEFSERYIQEKMERFGSFYEDKKINDMPALTNEQTFFMNACWYELGFTDDLKNTGALREARCILL